MERLAQVATIFLGAVALAFAMSVTRDLSAPMALGLALGVVLSPLSDMLERRGASTAVSALTSLAVALLALAALVMALQPVVMQLIETAPKVLRDIQEVAATFRGFSRGVSEFSKEVAQTMGEAPAAAPPAGAESAESAAPVPMPTVRDAILLAPALLGQMLTFAGTLFFFLLSRASIYDFVARRLSEPSNRAITADRLRDAENSVARYFLTVTAINAAMGLATAGILQVLGLPSAPLWGMLAFVLNFIVYLGPAVLAIALLFAGIGAFDGVMVVVPMAVFVTLNTVEGQFITPALVGKHMEINPLLVFVTILFGIWIWGPIGGIVAIPLLLWVRVLGSGAAPSQAPRAVAAR